MPYKDPAAAKAQAQRYYQRNKEKLWKNPDGTWKTTRTPEQKRQQQRESYERNKERINAERRAAAAANRREGDCPLCFAKGVRLVRDHCHRLGHTRGYICNHCNLALGHARDNAATLVRLIAYLGRSRS
ncbi:endonuclease domain-containing protein [Caldimonas sp. KR1-144]|uniref:endonuclease domain-containing protein n=1 Tax=Caldimonas sp. KR1-144 TaxID=3400911 RepID=UPI003C032252